MRTAGVDGYGFLNHTFSPFTGYHFRSRVQAETEFFRSAANLCALYNMELPDVSGLPFPENMSKAHAMIDKQLDNKKGISCYIMQDKKRMAAIATARAYDTGHSLYYIPVNPLARIGERPELKPLSKLLMGICHYLYKVTKIDYYRDETYLYTCGL
ncbi:hypothetical protein ACRQ5D_34425 [Mucilaginibacter sp. P25]|uniref:hypothetical protein n=1 Tax=Mucilaginibacter sp. P25 TaxID=3423945 RepID=UPI003D794A59